MLYNEVEYTRQIKPGQKEMISIDPAYNPQINQRFSAPTEDFSEITATKDLPSADAGEQQQDTVSLSVHGRRLSRENPAGLKKETASEEAPKSDAKKEQEQSARNFEVIQELKKRDADVRAHEQAHLSVAGRYAAGSASFTYQTGPDGTQYAIGGEVPIDVSAEDTPEATIQKMETIKRAALAPADPSSADRQIAAEASAKEIQAMQELQNRQRVKTTSQSTAADAGTMANQDSMGNPNVIPLSSADTPQDSFGRISIGNGRHMMIKTYQGIASLA
jgi:hypothetical protein